MRIDALPIALPPPSGPGSKPYDDPEGRSRATDRRVDAADGSTLAQDNPPDSPQFARAVMAAERLASMSGEPGRDAPNLRAARALAAYGEQADQEQREYLREVFGLDVYA